MGNIPRSYVTGNFLLTLDGAECGFLQSAEGGDAVGEVVSLAAGAGQFADKHIGAVRYEDIVLGVGLGMGEELYDWINTSWQREHLRKGGTIAAASVDGSIQLERTFADALISEVGFPALDGASKDTAYLTVKLRPDRVTVAKGGGTLRAKPPPKQKQWVASNFRLEIDGLDCKRVAKIDPFTVKQAAPKADPGEHRHVTEPATVEFPNLKITLGASSAASWEDWHENFLVKGNNGPDQERSGSLSLVAPDLTELARIELANLGIYALRRPPAAATDKVAQVVAELYCERMSLRVG